MADQVPEAKTPIYMLVFNSSIAVGALDSKSAGPVHQAKTHLGWGHERMLQASHRGRRSATMDTIVADCQEA